MKSRVLSIAALTQLVLCSHLFAAEVGGGASGNAAAGRPEPPASQTAKPELAKGKQTTLGLYVTAKEAYDKWQAEPEKVKILDVRTTEEYLFVGHPAMAWNIPFILQVYQWDASRKKLPIEPNPDFIPQVKWLFKPDDVILIMCRSGDRSALAVNLLAENGFRNAYTIFDGMEGDPVQDPESVFLGKRMKNGWKNSGLPWTYELDPQRMVLPKER